MRLMRIVDRLSRLSFVPGATAALVAALAVSLLGQGGGRSRVVVIGDIHSAYDNLVEILRRVELVDDTGRWTGGTATLVQLGDIMDRGAGVRQVMDLFIGLEARARIEGGEVVNLLGNHEVMNLLGETRDVTPEIFASFADAQSEARRAAAYAAYEKLVVRIPKYWEEIVTTAAMYGEKLPSEPDAKALAKFLIRQKTADPERFPDLSLTVIKLLGPGEYMMLEPGNEPYGHFSLAVTDYTHATAPNRRYVDLINRRLLKSVLDKVPSPYTREELEDLSAWLTSREKGSKKVERFMRKAAAAVLLQQRIGESFDALVTGASEKGTYVRLIKPF